MAKRRMTGATGIDAIAREFSKRLQHYTAEKGWNQTDLAREASKHLGKGKSIRRDNISLYMRGIQIPGPPRLRALAKALGKTDEDLLPSGMVLNDKSPPLAMKPLDDGNVWLQINQAVPSEIAMDIIALLRSRDAK
jgi:transcriptional regulator with XRE-family HTH domain